MATPTDKAEGINSFLNTLTGSDRVESITTDRCALCGKDASTFKDDLSRKEFTISGMCQVCQDSFFS